MLTYSQCGYCGLFHGESLWDCAQLCADEGIKRTLSTTYKPIDRTVGGYLPLGKKASAISVPVKAEATIRPVAAEPHTVTPDEQAWAIAYWADTLMEEGCWLRANLIRHAAVGGPATFLLALLTITHGKLAAIYTDAWRLHTALRDGWTPRTHHTTIGFHEPKRTQHIGVPVEHTTSEYLDVMDLLRENHIAAQRKGHLEMQAGRLRFVEQRLVGAEAAYDDLMGDEDMSDRSDELVFEGLSATFEAHRERILRIHEEQVAYERFVAGGANVATVPLADWTDEERKDSGLWDAWRMLRAEAGDKRILVQGGRERMEPTSSTKGADGKLEPTSVHRNEHASTYTIVSGQRVLRHAMAQDNEEPQRESAHSDEFDAGSGIKKAHTHPHLGLTGEQLDEQLTFERHTLGENAVAFLEAMEAGEQAVFNEGRYSDLIGWFRQVEWDSRPRRTFYSTLTVKAKDGTIVSQETTPTVTSWKRTAREVAWVCRRLTDSTVVMESREDPYPYIEERGAADAVLISEADYEEAYVSFDS